MKSFLVFVAACMVAVMSQDPPKQVHIAFAGDDGSGRSNGMSVSWVTINSTFTSIVKYGLTSGNLSMEASGSCDTYYETYDHTVILQNLAPSTLYYYSCGDEEGGFSSEFSFMSAPSSVFQGPFTVAVWGDMGVNNSMASIQRLIGMQDMVDFYWHIGDISYADDTWMYEPFYFAYEKTWNLYMNWVEDFTANKAYMVLPGNHESQCYAPSCFLDPARLQALTNFTAYNHRFRMPFPESGATSNMWYSFNYGPVHFVNLDTETDFPGAPMDDYFAKSGGFGDQMQWLQADLAKAASERNLRPWIVAAGHRPVYTLVSANETTHLPLSSNAALQAAIEDLFLQYDVDLFLSGHVHSYERQWPVYQGVPDKTYVNPKYPIYIITGAAGNVEGLEVLEYASAAPQPWNVLYNNENYGVSLMNIMNSTDLIWEFIDSSNGQVIDSVQIHKQH